MLRRYERTFGHLFRVSDAGLMVLAWLASYWLRFWFPLPVPSFLRVTKGLPDFSTYAALSPLILVLWIAVFSMMGAYESRRLLGRLHEVLLLLKAHGVALLAFVALTFMFEGYRYSRLVMLYFGIIGGVSVVAFRLTLRSLLRGLRKRGFNLRSVLAVGEGAMLESLIHRLECFPELGLRVKGLVTSEDSGATTILDQPVLGTFQNLLEIVRKVPVDEVLIALPPTHSQELDRLLELLKYETVEIRVVLDVNRYATLGCDVEDFEGMPVVRLNGSPLIGLSALAKRATDTLVSAVALVVLSPLLALIALLVKLTSPGPILYSQERMGLDGRSFRMFKFRSMRADAEVTSGAVWARAGDNRRTKFGTLLRRTSLDELPQLWNVLRGEMSLVGPRPERPVFVDQFRKTIPEYMLRHKVRAGITGWAQVNGWRGNTSLDRRIECDLFYIRNWSYTLDLKILTMTLWKGFIDKNAY
jgi:Undecaprenyl-phosphate glucose phosphotransferase